MSSLLDPVTQEILMNLFSSFGHVMNLLVTGCQKTTREQFEIIARVCLGFPFVHAFGSFGSGTATVSLKQITCYLGFYI